MHELSIALRVIDIVTAEAGKAGEVRVKQVDIDIGQWSGVMKEALEFSFSAAVRGTVMEKAGLVIHDVPGMLRCESCGEEFPAGDLTGACPACGKNHTTIIRGRELQVRSITVE